MEEYIDIIDSNGNKTGQSLGYNEVHRIGAIHRTVHIWLLNSKGQILLQKRSQNKKAHPGLWDISAAGHISAGQTSLEAATRETEEELGLALPGTAFVFLSTIKQPKIVHREDFIDDEFNDVYLVHCDSKNLDFKLQADEVEKVQWLDIQEFEKWVKGDGEPMVPHPEEHKLILKKLSSGHLIASRSYTL